MSTDSYTDGTSKTEPTPKHGSHDGGTSMPRVGRSTHVACTAAAVVSILLEGAAMPRELVERTGTSGPTVARAIRLLRRSGIRVDTLEHSRYQLAQPDEVRRKLSSALRLSLGDLVAAGGVSPSEGVGLLLEAGAVV